jgi:hypothetical protein
MFWLLEIFPTWLWWLLLTAGILAFLFAQLVPLTAYQLPVKISSSVVVAGVIFVLGVLYADGRWQQAARDLQQQVAVAEAKSQQVNTVVQERVVVKTQIVKQRGAATVEYVVREVVKHDAGCVIPTEFVTAHNRAAQTP